MILVSIAGFQGKGYEHARFLRPFYIYQGPDQKASCTTELNSIKIIKRGLFKYFPLLDTTKIHCRGFGMMTRARELGIP